MLGRPCLNGKEPEDVRQRILDSAMELFVDKGYAATSISDISSSANVNRALIYYYFKDKRDLYLSILKDENDTAVAIANEAYTSEKTAVKRIKAFIVGLSKLRIEHCSFGRVVMRGLLDNDLNVKEHMRDGFSKIQAILSKTISEGIDSGELREMDPERAVHIIFGITQSLVMMDMHEISSTLEENIDYAMDILESGVVNSSLEVAKNQIKVN